MPEQLRHVPEGGDESGAERDEPGRHRELNRPAHAFGVAVGELHRGDRAHVVTDEVRTFDAERLEESEQVTQSRLAFDAGVVGFSPAGTAKVGTDHAVALLGDQRRDLMPLPPMQREAVEHDDGFTVAHGGDVRAQAGRLDDEVIEPGCLGQRRCEIRRCGDRVTVRFRCTHDDSFVGAGNYVYSIPDGARVTGTQLISHPLSTPS